MKKLLILSTLLTAVGVSSAAEIGVRTIRHDSQYNLGGVTYNTKVRGVNSEFAYDRYSNNGFSVDRVSVLGVVDVAKVGPVAVTAKGGVAWLSPSTGSTGYAAMFGLAGAYPISKTTTVVVDVMNMSGQTRVSGADGTSISAGLKFTF